MGLALVPLCASNHQHQSPMKSRNMLQPERAGWPGAACLGLCAVVSAASAAETNAPAPVAPAPKAAATNAPPAATTNATPTAAASRPTEAAPMTPEQFFEGGTNTYNNWIELGMGGFLTKGNKAQAQQQNQNSSGAFGGIQDLHIQQEVSKGTTMTVDGQSIFDENDYKLSLGVEKEKLGYLRFSASQFKSWYNGDGGFYPPTGAYFGQPGDGLGLDRGDFAIEGGLTLEKAPKVTFKYEHTYREGQKSSTIWGYTHPAGGLLVQGLSPSIYEIDERSDIFQFDVTHHIKAVDVGVGLRYETGRMDDALRIDQFPGEAEQQKITNRQGTSYDLLNIHSFAESWVSKNVMLSSGFSFSDLDNDFSGSRVYGSDYDVSYVPNAQNGFGYNGLNGGSHLYEYVGDLNVFTRPWSHLTIVPSLRIQQQNADGASSGTETLGAYQSVPFTANDNLSDLDVRERLDVTYSGVTNWVFYARGELTEGDGTLAATGGLVPINGIGVPPTDQNTEIDRFFQKYSAGVRWYPDRRLTLDTGGYYKRNEYNYQNTLDSTPNNGTSPNRYPAYLTLQEFVTYDANVRATYRPRQNVSLVSRYEYQYSTVHTRPDEVSGLAEAESSQTISHIIGQDASWTPWSRLYLQAGVNYVLSQTKTPGLNDYQAILPAQNDYWTVNATSGLVLDDKTDLKLSFFYYLADDYQNNSLDGVPYGSGQETYAITAMLTRWISKNIRWSLKYGFSHSESDTFGGHQNFDAHLLYSSLQYRF
jgi:hypothetical protein